MGTLDLLAAAAAAAVAFFGKISIIDDDGEERRAKIRCTHSRLVMWDDDADDR
jgi:hypothetical protein